MSPDSGYLYLDDKTRIHQFEYNGNFSFVKLIQCFYINLMT